MPYYTTTFSFIAKTNAEAEKMLQKTMQSMREENAKPYVSKITKTPGNPNQTVSLDENIIKKLNITK